jgi:hypothetical protein
MKPTILAITSVVLLGSFAIAQNQTPEVPRSATGSRRLGHEYRATLGSSGRRHAGGEVFLCAERG